MRKFLFATTMYLGLLLVSNTLYAQQRTITGTVISSDQNSPLSGVSVTVKGTTRGTQTNASGQFTILAGTSDILQFSFIGYQPTEKTVTGASNYSIKLVSGQHQLGEVVVTAFGQSRQKKALGYSVQNIHGEDIVETGRTNFVNSLQGRVAGLQIGTTGGLPGASSSIVLRGGTSFDGNNQPLFVIDGIPVDNSTLAEGSLFNDAANRGADYANRMSDLDPNDIESITVLKGPAASALYGIDAANGAIIITTKKGKRGGMQVSYNNNFRFDKSVRFPQRQMVYGTGNNGISAKNTINHWGAAIPAGTPTFDNVNNFFQTGFTQSHNLSVSGGSNLLSSTLSLNTVDQTGTVPNTSYNRRSVRLNLSSEISPKLKLNGSANYISSFANKGTKGAGSYYYYSLIWPITSDMRNWQNDNGARVNLLDGTDDSFDNPFFDVNKNKSTDETKRILLNGSISYDINSWLNVTGRIGYDTYNTFGQSVYDTGSRQRYPNRSIAKSVGGLMSEYTQNFSLLNYYLLLNTNNTIGKFTVGFTGGLNVDERNSRVDSRYGETFLVPGFVSMNNTDPAKREMYVSGFKRRLIGVFGDLKIDYNKYLFLNITGRNDWSSTLPPQNRSFFYPSASVSFVFTDAFPNLFTSKWLNFGKLRASAAQVGKDAPPHRFNPALSQFTRTGGGFAVGFFGPNANIKPETTTSLEFGTELHFLNDRITLDATYYFVRSKDQIVSPRLSYASGYILQLVNAGVMENRGVELIINAKPVSKNDFSWNTIVNFAFNRNKVISLPGNFTEFYLSDTWLSGNARAGYVPGISYYSITGNKFAVSDKGQPLIGATGYPVADTRFTYIGNRQPKFTLGLINQLKYKNFNLSFLWDWRQGGDIYNGTDRDLTIAGLSMRTLDRGKQIVFDGVSSTGQPNTQQVTLTQAYFQSGVLGANVYNFIERDIYWVRLRDINLTYSLPKQALGNSFIKGVDFTVGANNIALFTNYSGADPDVNGLNASNRGSGAVGFDYFSLPAPVTFQFGINAKF